MRPASRFSWRSTPTVSSYIYGFALQERDLGFETADSAGEAAQRRARTIGAIENYPYLVEIATKLPESGYDSAVEFAWGLDLILDSLERLRHRAQPGPRAQLRASV